MFEGMCSEVVAHTCITLFLLIMYEFFACWVILHVFFFIYLFFFFFVICGFFVKIIFFNTIFQEYNQSVKQFGSRSGPTLWRA